ncbi:MAG TPA: outer membrane protein assembly factor BamA [Caulobacterales bacterium]|nr:outer membrane protein assembly factor BamA [Caulobacterales bacterium]
MKRVLRDVVVGAVASVATVGAGTSAFLSDAFAQTAPTPRATPPGAPGAAANNAAPAANAAQPSTAIRRIVVEGNQRIEPSTITSYLLVHPGDTFDPARIDLSLKTLFATGLFADVQIEQRDSDLVVSVIENPIINRVIFEGLHTLKEDDLEKEVQARPRSVFTPARAQADVQRIIELYRRSGRFAATVTPQVRELDQNRVDLIFEVDEGPVTGVRDINFLGNHEFNDRTLKDAIVTTESHWWNFFSKNDNYDPDRLEYDREQLRKFYNNRGYADFRVISAVAELTPDQKDFFVTFTVDEGQRYEFGDITVSTDLNRLPQGMLLAAVPIHSGEVFKGDQIEDAIDAITYVAGTVGYANVDVRPVIERDAEHRKVNIRFEVNEGPRVFIERIDIVGNTRTVDEVIRREMRVSEGDAFNRVLLDRSKNRIRGLGFFHDVKVDEAPGSQPDRSIVTVTVQEESTGELAFAAGYSSTENFLFDASISERNLRGRGQFLRLRASTSSYRQQVDLRFTEPRFMGKEMSAGVDLYSLRTDFLTQSSFENQSTGIGVRFGFPLSEHSSLGLNYSLIKDDTDIANLLVDADGDSVTTPNDIVDQCDPSYYARPILCDQEGTFITSMVGYTFNWDHRNDPITPTRGFDLSINQDIAGVGGQVNYLRTELESGIYYGIFPGWRASLHTSIGYIFGWGGDDVRINDRFFKGGSSFRGFKIAGIGPRQLLTTVDNQGTADPSDDVQTQFVRGDAVGGNMYAIGSLQLDFPNGLPDSFGIDSALFVDFGTLGIIDADSRQTRVISSPQNCSLTQAVQCTVTRQFVDDSPSFRASAGLSVFWDSPFGPVQFDFSQPLAYEEYDRREGFRFSTRTRF